ncbi:hypothetical protein D9758_000553 [Tetrapyrgos nigripes]|uniref:Aminoglycoside phosphotransferase domain-containing protein n=1 Tax=Tetrapyrgos nigripes TaxID=182062 RepID=A0A8H5H1W8_9AGAR|nr:hypothetical protein D9758_000553 [Tetrapyrgos nigripes]
MTTDLANIDELKEYLQKTPFASDGIDVLSGGTGNFACRVTLRAPYEGVSTAIVKHAKAYIFSTRDTSRLPFGLQRQKYEVEALKQVKSLLPADSLVTVPKVYFFDDKENVIIMEDSGLHSVPFKQLVMNGRCAPELGTKIGTALGDFLGKLHSWGKENISQVVDSFGAHQEAKTLSGWATYGRLVSTLDGSEELEALSGSALNVSAEDLDVVRDVGEKTQKVMLSAQETFLMGDFWPGNILVCLDDSGDLQRMYVIDWELTKPGLAGWDIGQLLAELDLLRRFHPSEREPVSKAISSFYESYSQAYPTDLDLWKTAVTHWGNHLVVWTPRVVWGDKQTTRETVLSGVKMIVDGQNGSSEDIYRLLM